MGLNQILQAIPQVRFICLDVANGYSQFFVDYVKKVREAYPDHTIMAGNVVTGDMVEALIFAGADIIKVGIGPGSVCTTRKKTGVGYPQLSAVMEVTYIYYADSIVTSTFLPPTSARTQPTA